jgi:hypothetical protein
MVCSSGTSYLNSIALIFAECLTNYFSAGRPLRCLQRSEIFDLTP